MAPTFSAKGQFDMVQSALAVSDAQILIQISDAEFGRIVMPETCKATIGHQAIRVSNAL